MGEIFGSFVAKEQVKIFFSPKAQKKLVKVF